MAIELAVCNPNTTDSQNSSSLRRSISPGEVLENGELRIEQTQVSISSNKPETVAGFDDNEDFIAFDFLGDFEDTSFIALEENRHESKAEGKRRALETDEKAEGRRKKRQKLNGTSRLTPWISEVDWSDCRNLAEMLQKEVQAFVDYISPTPEEHEVRGMIIECISRAIRSVWSDARVLPFGSYETKLYLPSGDIDLVVESRAMEYQDKRRILYSLAHVLRKANITSNVQVIAKAKVPIVKFVTNLGRFSVDISLNQSNGLKAGTVINRLLRRIPAVQPLVMAIKLFLNQRSMNEVYTGGLGSYALVCMVVSFLQMHPKIRAGEISPMQNLGVLLIEFFELYGHYYNYEKAGISIRDGGTYFDKVARDWDDPRNPTLLSIEDPVDITNDVSKNSYNMPRVRKTLAGAHEILTATAFMRCRVLMSNPRVSGSHRNSQYSQEESILSCILSVTPEILSHRRAVKQLYDRSTLQNLLGIPLKDKEDPTIDTLTRNEASDAVRGAWRNGSDMEESEDEQVMDNHKTNSDVEEKSLYSTRNSQKRRRLGNLNREEMSAIYVAESEGEGDQSEYDSESELTDDHGPPLERRHNPRPSSSSTQARRAYWASKGLSGGPESGGSD